VEEYLAWSAWFQPYVNNLSHYTKSLNQATSVHCFRFQMDQSRTPRMHFKEYAHASLIFKGIATEPEIAGVFGQVGTGFLILRAVPPGLFSCLSF
jgi:hypothetical protein